MVISEVFKYNSVDDFINTSGREYSDQMAEVLALGLIRDASFYEWCILNFNEIMDKEVEAIEYLFSRIEIIKQFFEAKDPTGKKEGKMLDFGCLIARGLQDFWGDKFTFAEFRGLGMIAQAYISYKREMLSKEEFYELRDMFVPFGLTISLDKFDVNMVLEAVKSDSSYDDTMKNFCLLKKIGKAVLVSDVTEEELKEGINSLIVEWD